MFDHFTQKQILFEDEDFILVDKPAGWPCHPTVDPKRPNLFDLLKAFLCVRDQKEVYLGIHHRLDRDTSGVLLLTKTLRVNSAIAALFAQRSFKKTYWVLAEQRLPLVKSEWIQRNYLDQIKKVQKKAYFGSVQQGGKFACTEFQLLKKCGKVLFLEAHPKTGRTHQIRVHLAEGGMPILGDDLYGGKQWIQGFSIRRMLLHAASVSFQHPITQEDVTVSSPMPHDFQKCLTFFENSLKVAEIQNEKFKIIKKLKQ